MKYYQKLTILMGLVFGFIAVQRIVIAILMPAIQADMKFSYTDVGLILSVTGFVWAFGTVFWAAIGDKLGRRPVIALTTILAAVFSWVTGFVTSLGQMLVVRGVLGFFEGGPWSPAVATVQEEAPEKFRGFLVGFIPASFMLIGVFLGPLVAVWLLTTLGSWRYVFYIISIPAAILGIIVVFAMHEPPSVAETIRMRKSGQKRVVSDEGRKVRLIDVLKYKNVIVSTVNSIPAMAWLFIYTGFSALFLVKVHGMSMGQIGLIMASSGVGGFIGDCTSGAISDHIGRKTTVITTAFLCALSGIAVATVPVGTTCTTFCILFFFWAMFGSGLWPQYLGTLPAESVPNEYAGTAVSIPTGVGEILGAAVMPTVAGMLADKFGLFAPMWMAAIAVLFICLVSLFYVETAPKKVAKMLRTPTRDDHLFKRFRIKPVRAL
jgi:MFS family permease